MTLPTRFATHTLIGALLAASACSRAPEELPVPPTDDGEVVTGAPRELAVVQLRAVPDSLAAARLRDSLERAGWEVLVRHQAGDTAPPFRVRVAPTPHVDMARLIAAGLVLQGHPAVVLRDEAVMRGRAVQAMRVNRGPAGMRARVRWTQSPDREGILVVEDATSAEDDPFPDGFLLATEAAASAAHPVLQRDSVWDVAPSPDWRRVAYGRAYLIRAENRDTVTWRHWSVIARRLNLEVSTVYEGGFLASGMASIYGFSQPVIESVGESPGSRTDVTRLIADAVPMAGGWRVGWTADGSAVGVGMAPRIGARDDSPATSWRTVEVERRLLTGVLRDPASLRRPQWTLGPVIDVTTTLPSSSSRIEFEGGSVEGHDGWVVLRSSATDGRPRVIGPGAPLAVTRRGRYIVALAPVPEAGANEPRVRATVYRVE